MLRVIITSLLAFLALTSSASALQLMPLPLFDPLTEKDVQAYRDLWKDGYEYGMQRLMAYFDGVMKALEEGDYTKEELIHLRKQLIFLGQLSLRICTPEEREKMQKGIEELLSEDLESYDEEEDSISYLPMSPIILTRGYTRPAQIVLCKSIWKKTVKGFKRFAKSTGRFFEDNLTPVICTVGAVATVGAIATVCVLSDGHPSTKFSDTPSEPFGKPLPIPSLLPLPERLPALSLSIAPSASSLVDQGLAVGRHLSSQLAHEIVQEIGSLAAAAEVFDSKVRNVLPDVAVDVMIPGMAAIASMAHEIPQAHEDIDALMGTDQASNYPNPHSKFTLGILPPPNPSELTSAASALKPALEKGAGTIAERLVTKAPSLNIGQLAEAGKALDRGGLTKAGRSLMKHGYRPESVFPKPTGNPMIINEQGQKMLESILNHPNKVVSQRNHERFGEIIDIRVPEKYGVRFTSDGKMLHFLEP